MTGLAIKELVHNILPKAQVKCFEDLVRVPSEFFHLFVFGLYGQEQEIHQQIPKVHEQVNAEKFIFLADQNSGSLMNVCRQHGSQLLARSASSMEIIDGLQVGLGVKSMLIEVLGAGRNAFQSPIQMPNASKPLTVKQVQVMELMLQGNTIRQISEALGLSVDTIKSHTKDAFHRLNASSRPSALGNYIQAKKLATHIQPDLMEHFMSNLMECSTN